MLDIHPSRRRPRPLLDVAGLDPDAVGGWSRVALDEDLADGVDVTSTATVPLDLVSTATFGTRARASSPACRWPPRSSRWCAADRRASSSMLVADGTLVEPGTEIARVTAPTQLLLTAERTALNLLCHLSGVATLTRRWVDALEGTGARVRDTRKTTPGLRALEKYAVRCGGGVNHRMGLYDMALVKDNHVAAAGGVAEAFALVRRLADDDSGRDRGRLDRRAARRRSRSVPMRS